VRSRAAKIVMALTVAAATVLAVTLVSNGGSSRNGSQLQNRPAISSFLTAGASKKCLYTATQSGRKVSLPPAKVNTEVRYTAVLRTNLGNIVIGLNSRAPCTVNSFVHLAEAGFFNHTQCHRLITAGIYILQCGDPYATARPRLTCSFSLSTGTPGYEFASENLKGATYPAGIVAMANAGTRTSNGSQFSRLSWLCGEVFPGQAEDSDFFGGRLVRVRCLKSGGDDDAAEPGGHVGGRWLGLRRVPRGAGPVIGHVGGIVAGVGVPAGGDGLAGKLERDGPLDRAGGAVAGLPAADDLAGVFDRDFDGPPGRVSLDHLGGGGGGIGGDQGQVIAGR
jgi:cyclophilin family peptidyl-prolyl cis-trans isomerase